MYAPFICKFTTASANYDLFANTTIRSSLEKQFGSSILEDIDNGKACMVLTVLVDSITQIRLSSEYDWNDFIKDIVYSSVGTINPTHCYIKDTGISGTLMIQVQ